MQVSSTITFPATPIPYTSSVEVYFAASLSVSLNGEANQTSPSPADWFEIANGSGEITSIKFTGAYGGTVRGIKVDGVQLLDPYIWSVRQAGSDPGSYVADPANRTLTLTTPANAFDGNLFSQVQVGNTADPGDFGGWYYWTPNITGVKSLRYGYNGSAPPTEVRINGTIVTYTLGNSGPSTAAGSDFWCDITVPQRSS